MNNVPVFGEFGATNVHPLAITFVAFMIVLAFLPKRSAALLAFLSVCVFMPEEQRVVVAGVDFSMLRLITLVLWIRVFVRGEYRGFSFGRLDRIVVLWLFSASFFYVLRVGPSAIVYRLGLFFDASTAFFLIRMLVRTRAQVLVLSRQLAWISVVLAPFMLYEAVAQHNVFGVFTSGLVEIRDGRARAQGAWSHPILGGTFGSVLVPVFIAVFLGLKKQRYLFGWACIAGTIIVVTSGSSGPLIAWAVGILGWGLWRFRRYTRPMLYAAVFAAVVIHFIREMPVWHLMTRLGSIIGGTGDHRFRLIDAFIRRFPEWALMGSDDTLNWGWGLVDTTNQYVVEGTSGGLVSLVLLLVMLAMTFVQLRRTRELFERREGPKSLWALLAWGSSVSLAAHCVSFMSVSYFGQFFQFFFVFLATVPALARFRRPKQVKVPVPRPAGSVSRERRHFVSR